MARANVSWGLVAGFVTSLVAGALLVGASTVRADKPDDKFPVHVGKEGGIRLPTNFRSRMVHIGSWFVPDGGASGFHDVFTEQGSLDAFRRDGKFPDGATLVKELRASEASDYTTGAGVSHATSEIKQWFVMVKDEKGRFPGNPLWGDGWGWGLFKPDAPSTNIATDYQADCLGCHIPAKATDWVYTEGYPSLGADQP